MISTALTLACGAGPTLAAGDFTASDYQRALWMTTRFYGAQRMGAGPNWLLMDHTHKTSYVKDAADGRDLSGGWADCGDYPLFGQTFFYSVYTLLKAYDTYPTGFPDMYHGFDYSDYAAAKDWTQAGGKPDGIPDLLQEVKYATDWIIKAAPDANTFYYQKGTGGASAYGQHKYWVTSSFYSVTHNAVDGGEKDKSRPVLRLGKASGNGDGVVNDGSMPSFAAAALAIMARVYHKYDPAYADSCLKHARFAFDYAKNQSTTGTTGFGGFYPANNHMNDDIVTAATELYRTTNEGTYKSFAEGKKDGPKNHYYTYSYATNDDVAYFNMGKFLNLSDKWSSFKSLYVDKYKNAGTGEGGLSTIGDSWGFLRYPANQAFIVSLYAKAQSDASYDQFIYDQVDFIMGGNNAKQSFITGFCAGCSKSPQFPHHRNVYLDDNDKMKSITGIPARNKEFGYLVGYTKASSGAFQESMSAYEQTEGGIDYNAGLVGALGYIVSKLAPVDTSKLGKPLSVKTRTASTSFRILSNGSSTRFLSDDASTLDVMSADGSHVWSGRFTDGTSTWSAPSARGMFVAVARTPSGSTSAMRFVRD